MGDKVSIIGNATGIKNMKVKQMEIEKKPTEKAKKGQNIGLKVPSRVRKNDKIYKIIKNKGSLLKRYTTNKKIKNKKEVCLC